MMLEIRFQKKWVEFSLDFWEQNITLFLTTSFAASVKRTRFPSIQQKQGIALTEVILQSVYTT